MRSHLNLCCTRYLVYNSIAKHGDTKKQYVLSFKKMGDSGATSLEVHSFSKEKCRNSLARMCIKDNKPFSIVEDDGCMDYSWDLQPMFKFPSRWTIKKDCLQIYKEELYQLMDVLKNHTVSITIDTWTSIQNINYGCLTVHWVDEMWVLRKKFRSFFPLQIKKGLSIGKFIYVSAYRIGELRRFLQLLSIMIPQMIGQLGIYQPRLWDPVLF